MTAEQDRHAILRCLDAEAIDRDVVVDAVEVLLRYERRNRVVAPLVRGVLSRLLGWRYTGTDGDRRRAVAQLPLVAFTPVD